MYEFGNSLLCGTQNTVRGVINIRTLPLCPDSALKMILKAYFIHQNQITCENHKLCQFWALIKYS